MKTNETIQFIESKGKWGMKLGLETIGELLKRLGDPQKDLKFIHVAGSNGKGSICRILETALEVSGYKTGLYSSPALEDFRERIRVGTEMIPKKEVDRLFEKIHQAGTQMEEDGYSYPTAFEIETAMALLYFKEQRCEICIMEVGLGGRLDATNIIPSPILSIISKISLEHTQYLGDTIELIAAEKAAIIKEGSNVVVSYQEEGAKNVIHEVAGKNKAKQIIDIDLDEITFIDEDLSGQRLKYKNQELKLGLLGDFQRMNLLVALKALEVLTAEGYQIDFNKVYQALSTLSFPGRLEVISRSPLVLIDGAHNIDGITTLRESIEKLAQGKKIKLFFGMLKEKDIKGSIKELTKISDDLILLTPDSPEALEAKELEKLVKSIRPVKTTVLESYEEVKEQIDPDDSSTINLFTGSLYLIGALRKILQEKV